MHTTSFTHPDLPSDALLEALDDGGFDLGPPARSSRTVLDTFDGRLHDAGLRLELRQDAGARLVLASATGTAPPAILDWSKVPTWPSELPAGPFRSRVASVTKERCLLPLVTVTSTRRTGRRADRRGKAVVVVEVHDDLAAAGHDEAILPPWLAELHPVVGHPDAASSTTADLDRLGFTTRGGDLVAMVAAAAGTPLAGRTSSPTVPLEPDEEALGGYRRVLANLADTIDANLPGTIADADPEFLHELRVAVRRTRSVLSRGKKVIPDPVRDRFREEFRWLGQVTTPPRDLDVYLLDWDEHTAPLPPTEKAMLEAVRAELEDRRRGAHQELAATLDDDRAGEILTAWRGWLDEPAVEAPRPRPLGPLVARRIVKAQQAVLDGGRAIEADTPGEALHDLRKEAKKLRYLLECFGSLLAAKPRKAFVRQLKDLQDNLGDHQDAEVHLAQLREIAADLHGRPGVDADVLLAIGRLASVHDDRRQHERDEFADRFAAYDTKANRQELDDLLRPIADA